MLLVVCFLSVFRRDLRRNTPFHLAYLSALRPVPCAGFLYPYLLHHNSRGYSKGKGGNKNAYNSSLVRSKVVVKVDIR